MSSHVEVRLPAFFCVFFSIRPLRGRCGWGVAMRWGLALAEKSTVKIIVPDLEHLEL